MPAITSPLGGFVVRRLLLLNLLLAPVLSAAIKPEAIAPRVHLIRGAFVQGQQPDGNTVVLEAPEGLVVIDTGRHAAHTQRILDLATASGQPVVAILNTHWHLDHVGGNILIRKTWPEVKVYATPAIEQALDGFLARYRTSLEKAIEAAEGKPHEQTTLRTEMALIDAGENLGPTAPITASAPRSIAGRRLGIHMEKAVTGGDLWVFDAETGILIAGDLVTLPVPFLDTACASRWSEALGRLAGTDFDLLVPGHGAPMTRTQFATYRSGFNQLLSCAASDATNERCAADWIDRLGDLIPRSEHDFTRGLLDYYIKQHLRAKDRTAELCQ